MSDQVPGRKFYVQMRPRLISTKSRKKLKSSERKDLHKIQRIKAYLSIMMEAVFWIGLAWLLMEQIHSYLLMMKLKMVEAE